MVKDPKNKVIPIKVGGKGDYNNKVGVKVKRKQKKSERPFK